MYCSSQKGFKAPQLGPRAYRIWKVCPACGFGIKPLVSFGPIDLRGRREYCREHILNTGTHRTHPGRLVQRSEVFADTVPDAGGTHATVQAMLARRCGLNHEVLIGGRRYCTHP
jgi:hypothetical protein